MFERIYTSIRTLTGFPYSDTILRDTDIELQVIHNVATAAKKARREGDGEAFARFSPTMVGAALGVTRKVVRAAFYALVAAGLHERKTEGNRLLFRPRQIDHDRAEAFARHVERQEALPSEEWWKAGTYYPLSLTSPVTRLDSGYKLPTDGYLVPTRGAESTRPNGETPGQTRGFASEEVGKEEREELQSQMSTPPSPPIASPSGSGSTEPDIEPQDKDAVGEDGLGYGCADCSRALDVATVAEIRRRVAAGEDIAWSHASGPLGRCP